MSVYARVLLAFFKLAPLLERLILKNPWIATENKDSLISNLRDVRESLNDAEKRRRGSLPLTPNQKKEFERRKNKLFPKTVTGSSGR